MTTPTHLIQIGKKSFSRGEISRGTGISLSHVSRVFGGSRVPSVAVLEKLSVFSTESIGTVLESIAVSSKQSLETKMAPARQG